MTANLQVGNYIELNEKVKKNAHLDRLNMVAAGPQRSYYG